MPVSRTASIKGLVSSMSDTTGTNEFSSSKTPRLNYEASCRFLQQIGALEGTDILPLPAQMPSQSDEGPLGVSFHKTGVWDDTWANFTLPRTFIGRSEVSQISFPNTDFSESRFCWNDFVDVDFSDAVLRDCDLRSSLFQKVVFARANMSGADLRHSQFEDCDFTDASLRGAKITVAQGETMNLASTQRSEIDWQDEDGVEPDGG